MTINVIPKMDNLCYPVRNSMELAEISHLSVLNACNGHLGKLKIQKQGDDKRSDMKVNTKKDTSRVSVKPGAVTFGDTYNIVSLFISWHDAIAKAHSVANMEQVTIPAVFSEWLQFAKAKPVEAEIAAKS